MARVIPRIIAGKGYVRMVPAADGTFFGRPMTAGNAYIVAGGGSTTLTTAFASASATALELDGTSMGTAVDKAGNLYFEQDKDCAVVLPGADATLLGKAMTAGTAYALPGIRGGTNTFGLAVNSSGDLVIGQKGGWAVLGHST